MSKYVLKRLLQLVPVLFFVSLFVFLIIHFIPGDPVEVMLGEDDAVASQELYDALRKRLGLDAPIHIQYLRWMGNVLQGDLGQSMQTGEPVWDMVKARYPATIYLALSAFFLGILISIPAGAIAAVKQNTLVDYSAMGFAMFGISVPNFWLALLLILGLSLYVRVFPTMGYVDPSVHFGLFLWHLVLPSIVLGTAMASSITRFVRAEMLEQLRLDYVRTAKAKGLPPRTIVSRHVLKNSLVAATTVIGLQVGRLFGGSTIVETIFSWPGVALLVLESVYARDYPLLQGSVLFLSVTYVFVNLVVDVIYKWLDPRIQLG